MWTCLSSLRGVPASSTMLIALSLPLLALGDPSISVVNGSVFFNINAEANVFVARPVSSSIGSPTSSSALVTEARLEAVFSTLTASFQASMTNMTLALQQETSRATAAETALSTLVSSLNVSTTSSIAALGFLASANLSTTQTGLSSAIAVVGTRALTAEASLLTAINTEVSRATAADAAFSATNTSASATAAALSAEVARALAADASLGAGLAAETSRGGLVENALNVSVLEERNRAIAIESSLSAATAAEVVRATGVEATVSASVVAERVRAVSIESSIATSVSAEVARAVANEGSLSAATAAEVVRATGVEATVSASVVAERVRAVGIEASLASSVWAEATRAIAIESSLSAATAAEVVRATGVEATVSASVVAERVRAVGVENTLIANLAAEVSRATAAENAISVIGASTNPGASCSDILSRRPGVASGMFYIRLGTSVSFPVYCDMITDGGGWTMVYKVSNAQGPVADVVNAWNNAPLNEASTAPIAITATPVGPYSNRLAAASNWNANGNIVTTVRVHLYTAGSLVKQLKFNGLGTTSTNWFSPSTYVSSTPSWTDIPSATFNFFSIPGDSASYGRTWFISQNYGGCNGDVGWLTISANVGPCPWESAYGTTKPAILYAPGATSINWGPAATGCACSLADVFAVFVR